MRRFALGGKLIYYTFLNDEYYCRYKNPHEAEHAAAMRLLEKAVKKEYSLDRLPEIVKGEHGKPYFKDSGIKFSLSHCKGMAVCAVYQKETGVDCEGCGRTNFRAAKRFFTAEEFAELEEAEEKERSRVLAEIWTAKEAYGKAIGKGLFGGLSEITLMNREKAGDICLKQFRIYRDKEEFILTAALLGEKITDNEPVFCEILL